MGGGLRKRLWSSFHSTAIPKIAAKLVLGGLAKSTHRRYSAAVGHFSEFCDHMQDDTGVDHPVLLTGHDPWRDEEQLLHYVAYLGWLQGCMASTVKSKLAAISWHHRQNGLPDPVADKARLKAAVRALKRLRGESKSKLAVTPTMLRRIKASLDFDKEEHIVLWAGLMLGFFFLMRASEYCAVNGVLDPSKGLTCWKLMPDDDKGRLATAFEMALALTVLFESDKTDQNKIGCTRTAYATESDLCVVEAVKMLRRMRGSNWHDDHPALMTNSGYVLTREVVSEALRAAAVDCGIPASSLASHSLRIGGATALHAAGWTDEDVRRFGRWASDCWRRYVYSNRHEVRGVARSMATVDFDVQLSAADFHRRAAQERPDPDDEPVFAV